MSTKNIEKLYDECVRISVNGRVDKNSVVYSYNEIIHNSEINQMTT